jgi:hypothetical protein
VPASAQSDDLAALSGTAVSNTELNEIRGEGLESALPGLVQPILFQAAEVVKPFIPGGPIVSNALRAGHDMAKNAIRNLRG